MQEVENGPKRPWQSSGEHGPKDILAFEYGPERKLAHFVVQLRNSPGALEASASLATRHHVNICSGFHHSFPASGDGFWSFFADFAEADVEPNEFATELGFLPSSLDVRFKVARSGLLIDSFHFPVRWGGQRAITIHTSSLLSIFNGILGVFGDGAAAKVLLYKMGETAGRQAMRDLLNQLGREMVRSELRSLVELYSANGWGVFEPISLDLVRRRVEVRVRDNFECANFMDASVSKSNFVRGHLAGCFSELVGEQVDAIEEYCIAKHDPYCYFVVQSRSAYGV